MKAAVHHGPGRLTVDEIPTPAVGAGDVLVGARAASICGTDMRIHRSGHRRIADGQSRVLGHEIAGLVIEADAVSGFHPGDRVSVVPNLGCGTCRECRLGLNNMCADHDAFGITMDGGFAEYVHVPARAVMRGNLVRLPSAVSYVAGALIEPFSCCYRGQRQVGVGYEDVVVIVGAGPIGACHVMLARLAGASRIIVSDLVTTRLQLAASLGADVTVGPDSDLETIVRAETGGRGADVVITTVSSPDVQSSAVRLLAPMGRLNLFAGLSPDAPAAIDTNLVHYRALLVTGTTGSSYADYAAAMRIVGEGRVDLEAIASATFPVERIHDAIDHAASGAGMKPIIVFDDPSPDGR